MNNSVEELMSQIRELTRQNNELTMTLKEQSEEIKQLSQIIANLSRRMYGTKSEKTHHGQLSLFEDDILPFNEAETTAEQPVETKTMTVKKGKFKGRKEELVKDLPEVIHIHELNKDEKQCDCCGHHLHEMTENYVRCEVEFIPARLIKHVHKQKVYECRHCKQHSDKAFIKKADLPKTVINNSLSSPSVLAHLCCQKNEYSLPFYRQTK